METAYKPPIFLFLYFSAPIKPFSTLKAVNTDLFLEVLEVLLAVPIFLLGGGVTPEEREGPVGWRPLQMRSEELLSNFEDLHWLSRVLTAFGVLNGV